MYDLRLMKPKDSNLTEPDRMFKEDWDKNSKSRYEKLVDF